MPATLYEIFMVLMFTDKHVNYLGCFVDSPFRKLEFSMGDSSTNTPTECIRKCSEAGYKYTGVQVQLLKAFRITGSSGSVDGFC